MRGPSTTPAGGWYPTGRDATVAEWDGAAWTGRRRTDAEAGGVAPRRVRPFAVLGHLWFWLLVAGLVLVGWAGFLGQGASERWWQILSAVGMIAIMSSIVVLFDRVLRFGEIPRLGLVALAGLASGVVAILIAWLVEPVLEPALGVPFAVDLWLSGPVEESAKLALPFVLLVVSRRLFGDPRAGMLMVLMSGAAFGMWEGYGYATSTTGENGLVLAGLIRGLGEVTHPLWTAIAAALIWLAAHRARRIPTLAGFVGWLVAMALHSLHDGIGAFHVSGTQNTIADSGATTLTGAILIAVVLNVVTLISILITMLILRPVARELVPPTAVADNPPRWRPRIRLWGVPRRDRTTPEPAAL